MQDAHHSSCASQWARHRQRAWYSPALELDPGRGTPDHGKLKLPSMPLPLADGELPGSGGGWGYQTPPAPLPLPVPPRQALGAALRVTLPASLPRLVLGRNGLQGLAGMVLSGEAISALARRCLPVA